MNTHKAILLLSAAILTTLSGCEKPVEPTPPPTPPEVKVTSVTVTPATLSLVEGESQDLKAAVLPSNATNPKVTWTSSDTQVATVTDGTVKAVKPGTATITATADGKQGTCAVTVTAKGIPVSGVKLDVTTASISVEESFSLTATVEPEDATDKSVSWSSSAPDVATVDQEGTVTGVEAGVAVIMVTTTDGALTASCEVTVTPKVIPVAKMEATKLADMNTGRSSFAIFRTGNEIVVAGGHVNGFSVTNTAEYYDAETDKWTSLPNMSAHHDNTAFAALGDGKYMVLGGCRSGGGSGTHKNVDIYDPATHSFSSGPAMTTGRALFHALGLGNGNVLVAGNWYNSDSIEEYSAEKNEFSSLKDVSQSRSYPYLLRTSEDNAIVFGNYSTNGSAVGEIRIDRYKGDAFTAPLFLSWRPFSTDAGWGSELSAFGKNQTGEYCHLIPVFRGRSSAEASEIGVCLVSGEEFSLVETDYEIPVNDMNGNRICYAALVTDPSKKVAYYFGSSILNSGPNNVTCYIVSVDCSKIDDGGKAKVKLYYTDPIESFNCGGQGGFILLPDGRLMVCGGIYNSNYTTYSNAYAFKPF